LTAYLVSVVFLVVVFFAVLAFLVVAFFSVAGLSAFTLAGLALAATTGFVVFRLRTFPYEPITRLPFAVFFIAFSHDL